MAHEQDRADQVAGSCAGGSVTKAQLAEVALEIGRMLDRAILDECDGSDEHGPMIGAKPDPVSSASIFVVLADGTEVTLRVCE